MNDSENDGGERECLPTGFALCATHPSCDYVRATRRELWQKCDRMTSVHNELVNLVKLAVERWKPDDLQQCGDFMRRAAEVLRRCGNVCD